MIRSICDANGISVLDFTDAIYENGDLTLYKDYLHLNWAGNDIIADNLESFVSETLGRVPCVREKSLTP